MDEQLLARLDERGKHMEEKIDRILEQTTKTNGTVTQHGIEINSLKTWKEVREGQGKVLYWVGGVLLAVLGFLVKHFLG